MLSLARSNINHDWRMFLSAAVVLFLSGSLIFVSVGITQANIRSLTAYKRSLPVDIYIQPEEIRNFRELNTFLNESHLYPEIEFAEPLIDNFIGFRSTSVLVDNIEQQLKITALELEKPSVTIPRYISDEAKEALKRTGTVIVSATLKAKPGFEFGDLIWDESESFALEIIGHFDAEINRSSLISQSGSAFVSRETERLFFSNSTSQNRRFRTSGAFNTVAVKVDSGFVIERARHSLEQKLKVQKLTVKTSEDLVKTESLKGALENKVLQGFLIFCFFAVSIPFFIIVQTLKSAILSQTKQFAIMKALGVQSWKLARIAMEQAFWIGVLGAGLSYCGMTLLKVQFRKWNVDFFISQNTAFVVCATIVLGSLIAGTLSIGTISKARPLDMLR